MFDRGSSMDFMMHHTAALKVLRHYWGIHLLYTHYNAGEGVARIESSRRLQLCNAYRPIKLVGLSSIHVSGPVSIAAVVKKLYL